MGQHITGQLIVIIIVVIIESHPVARSCTMILHRSCTM
jgi:hypothetical protein